MRTTVREMQWTTEPCGPSTTANHRCTSSRQIASASGDRWDRDQSWGQLWKGRAHGRRSFPRRVAETREQSSCAQILL